MSKTPTANYRRTDLKKFDRSEGAFLAHWRGFSKYRQPDGTVIACDTSNDDVGLLLGPCADAHEADDLIRDFYDSRS